MRTLITILLFLPSLIFPQHNIFQIMTYNLLNYPGNDTLTRNPYFRTVFSEVRPDILVVQEMTSQQGVNGFLNNVLNAVSTDHSTYSSGVFIDGVDTDNAIFFVDSLFQFISNTPIKTDLRDISEFKIVYKKTSDTLRIFSAHLKASSGSSNEIQRASEVDVLRKVTNSLPKGSNYIVVGDFNIYSANESAFQELLDTTQIGYFIDPLGLTGNWNSNPSLANYFTQSTRIRQFGGGSTGGLDDRFDMILISQGVKDAGGITYNSGSYYAYGNDGLHFNDSINRPPNGAVTQAIANALEYTSDHLPVIASFFADEPLPVELTNFYAQTSGSDIELSWTTATETNNRGFQLERKKANGIFHPIAFIKGKGTTTELQNYKFIDHNLLLGIYVYRLKQINYNGAFQYSKTITSQLNVPNDFKLYPNYPNPFNPVTTIKFSIPHDEMVQIKIYNILGEQLEILLDKF